MKHTSHTGTTLKSFLSALFSDETERYRCPAEPDAGQPVRLRLRTARTEDAEAFLLIDGQDEPLPMREAESNTWFTWYQIELTCPDQPLRYCFLIHWNRHRFLVQRAGVVLLHRGDKLDHSLSFRLTPGFHTPDWARGAVQYQLFVDRFCNGCRDNDVADREYFYDKSPVRFVDDWNKSPTIGDFRHFYGGDLQGVMQKLDYLQELGVEAIYFNPIFLSPSSHKYDAMDYAHIDPHFAVIEEDKDVDLPSSAHYNTQAERFITRVTSQVNLEKSDALFAELCQEMHRRGMRVILDGVFNHCGSFGHWMDKEGIYKKIGAAVSGAYQSVKSPYRHFFLFMNQYPGYEAWWGFESLPKLNYEDAPDLCERIIELACHWAKPPYSIDGWRLDVAADLGHSLSFNHRFWAEFRRRLKEVNPDLLILAEHYGDPSSWLQGDQWDSVMNYDAFMDPLSYFLTGMEKHSEASREDLYNDSGAFFSTICRNMARFDWGSLQCAMNELSNHDHSRFLTRTNRCVGRLHTVGPEAAMENIDKRIFREAVVIQMTWPGAPTVYYADEAGQVGWTDPDNRRTYPWGREDTALIELHRDLIALRHSRPVLRNGSFKPLAAGDGWIAYARFDEEDCAVIVCNNTLEPCGVSLRVRDAGAMDGDTFVCAFRTLENGHVCDGEALGTVKDGKLRLSLPPRAAIVAVRQLISE